MATAEAAAGAESALSAHLEGSRRLLMLKQEDRWPLGASFASSMAGGAAAVKKKSNKNKVNSERVHLRCERDGERRARRARMRDAWMESARARAERERN